MSIVDTIKQQLSTHPILLYMKGSPDAPQCGFSARTSEALQKTGLPFAFVDVLAHPTIRERLPQVSNWPTFPQLFVGGELVGGCDIVCELARTGELETLLQQAVPQPEMAET